MTAPDDHGDPRCPPHGPMAEHRHTHNGHTHDHHAHGPGGHSHPTGVKGFLYGLFIPHSHDAANSIDDALEANKEGIRALKVSMAILLITTSLQVAVVAISGSVALLADTIHNFADALTAVPLWIAFVLGRRAATRRYTYGFGRAEDLAGLFIVAVIALSAVLAAWQSIGRFFDPQPLENLWWVLAAGVIGFAGNEIVAIYRIRIGQKIGSAALVADGVHARMDGFTSLAVVIGALGVMLGYPIADPVIGLVISVAIIVLLIGTVKSIGRRLMDGIEPVYLDTARNALGNTPGVLEVRSIQLRWIGHRLHGAATITVPDMPLSNAEAIATHAASCLGKALPNIEDMVIRTVPS